MEAFIFNNHFPASIQMPTFQRHLLTRAMRLLGLKDEGCTGRKPSLSEDPSPSLSEDSSRSSTYERENKGVEFQISDSSINTPDQTLDSHGAGNTSNPSEFENHGLLFWTQSREQWIGNKRKENRVQQVIEPRLSSNATHDSVLVTNKPYVQPIPLSEMVDFLLGMWEQEGIWDI